MGARTVSLNLKQTRALVAVGRPLVLPLYLGDQTRFVKLDFGLRSAGEYVTDTRLNRLCVVAPLERSEQGKTFGNKEERLFLKTAI